MTRIAILTGPGFQADDVLYTYYRCIEAGIGVDVATKDALPVTSKGGEHTVPLNKLSAPLVAFADLRVEDYDGVIATGGFEAPDRVRRDQHVRAFVRDMDAAGKVVGGLCHGSWILVSAGIMRDRTACSYEGMADDMVHAGANVIDAPVVVDGNLVTANYYHWCGAFMAAFLDVLAVRA